MKKLGADVLMQERMVFVSLLAAWLLGMLITIVVFRSGKWKNKMKNA